MAPPRRCSRRSPVTYALAAFLLLTVLWACGVPGTVRQALRIGVTTTTQAPSTKPPPVQLQPYDRWELEKRIRQAVDDALRLRLPRVRQDGREASGVPACKHFTCMSTFRPQSKTFKGNITVTDVGLLLIAGRTRDVLSERCPPHPPCTCPPDIALLQPPSYLPPPLLCSWSDELSRHFFGLRGPNAA